MDNQPFETQNLNTRDRDSGSVPPPPGQPASPGGMPGGTPPWRQAPSPVPFPAPPTNNFSVEPVNVPPLEPLTPGEIIDRSILILKNNFKPFGLISLLIYGPLMLFTVLYLIFFAAVGGTAVDSHENTGLLCLNAVVMIGLGSVSLILWIALTGVAVKMTSEYMLGNRITLKEAGQFLLRNVAPLAVALILMSVIMGGIAFAAMIGVGALLALNNITTSILAILLGVLLLLGLMYLAFAYTLVPQVVLLENIGGFEALRRSRELFHSSGDSVTKVLTVPVLINIFTQIFSSIPYLGILLVLFVVPLPVIGATVLYYDTRINAEAFDLETRVDAMLQEYTAPVPPA